jgi:ATP-dependent protease ClpP protease subunit
VLLAAVVAPALAKAQDAPVIPDVTVPPVPPPAPSPPAPPLPQPPAQSSAGSAPRSATISVNAIDKTKSYYVFFDQGIDVPAMRKLRSQLATLVEAGVSDITLVINSSGGLLQQALITYGLIRALPVRIKAHAQGFVASAAMLPFLAADTRSADRSARFVFHPSRVPMNGAMAQEQLHEYQSALGSMEDMMADIYRDRTRLTDSEIARFGHEEVIYTAEQAQAFGVIQTVADLRMPGDGKARMLFLD